MDKEWIGVDLDGTLAVFDTFKGWDHIGLPIKEIVDIVKNHIAQGIEVRIFTARVAPIESKVSHIEVSRKAIEVWCLLHIGKVLPITCVKDVFCIRIYDDIAVAIEKNSGRMLCFK